MWARVRNVGCRIVRNIEMLSVSLGNMLGMLGLSWWNILGMLAISLGVSLVGSVRNVKFFIRKNRLQLKRGLFWYRHYPKLHEMVKYRSSRAENLTNLREISMPVFFNSKRFAQSAGPVSRFVQSMIGTIRCSIWRVFLLHFAPLGSFLEQFWTLGVIFEALCSHFWC